MTGNVEQSYSISFVNELDYSSTSISRKHPHNARVTSAEEFKNNLRGITLGIRPMWMLVKINIGIRSIWILVKITLGIRPMWILVKNTLGIRPMWILVKINLGIRPMWILVKITLGIRSIWRIHSPTLHPLLYLININNGNCHKL